MTRAEKVATARQMREGGALLREIAEAMGVAIQTAHQWLSDPDLAKLRARKDSYAGTCSDCGGPTSGGNGAAAAPDRCRTCIEAAQRVRRERIAAAWQTGEPTESIAAREGVTTAAILTIVDHLRRFEGADLTRRRRANRELWPLIERRWREGATLAEIGEEAGASVDSVWQMVKQMRRLGMDLPRRADRRAVAA